MFLIFLHPPSLPPSVVVLHEAVCTGNPELIGMVLRSRDQQQKTLTTQEIPLMLERLRNASDFYIEMKWEFSSWGELLNTVFAHSSLILPKLLIRSGQCLANYK